MKSRSTIGLVFAVSLVAAGALSAQDGRVAEGPALPVGLFAADAEEVAGQLVVAPGQCKLLRAAADIGRTAVDDETVCRVLVTTPRELTVEGRKPGSTRITFWLKDDTHQPVTIAVRVAEPGQDGK